MKNFVIPLIITICLGVSSLIEGSSKECPNIRETTLKAYPNTHKLSIRYDTLWMIDDVNNLPCEEAEQKIQIWLARTLALSGAH